MTTNDDIKNLLNNNFTPKQVDAVLKHFEETILSFKNGDWEKSLLKSGKFVEATIKLICGFGGIALPQPRKFKVGDAIIKIQNGDPAILGDSIRLQITRACSFVYDLASNRGARHDPGEVNPNEMDATTNCSTCSWILAELTRLSSKNSLDISQAKLLVDSLVERQYPIFENIDGRIYVEKNKYGGAIECALLILYSLGNNRISKKELLRQLQINGIKTSSINFDRLKPFIDIDNNKEILLRNSGRIRAEQIIKGSP
jgi:hypothetical protein